MSTNKLHWQIKYVDRGLNMQVEPIDIKCFKYEEIEQALNYLDIVTETNIAINGKETWFVLELVREEKDVCYKVLKKTYEE